MTKRKDQSKPKTERRTEAHYFVDEAGDLTFFDKKGRSVLGTPGVSNCFMVGATWLPDPAAAKQQLDLLRQEILADPTLHHIHSLKPEQKKTALYFHAKDDHELVRDRVFGLLETLQATAFIAIRRKAEYGGIDVGIGRYIYHSSGRVLTADEVYDDLVSRTIRNRLHLADNNRVTVAKRGTSDRQQALNDAVERAKVNFQARWGTRDYGPVIIKTLRPSDSAGLQITDYLLWAVQRLYERREDRHFARVAGRYGLIMDLDDDRQKAYGEWYSKTRPLTLEKIKPVTG